MPRPRIPDVLTDERRASAILLPWAIMTAIGLLSVLVPPYPKGWIVPVLATAISLSAGAMYVISRRYAEGGRLELSTAFVPFLFVAVVRHGTGAGESPMTALLLLPILGFALTGTRRQLWACTGAVIATLVVPVLVIGPPDYPYGDWRTLLWWTGVSVVVAPVIQRMVERLEDERRQVHTANTRVERLFDDAPHGVVLLNTKGRILRANTALAALVGVSPDDMVRHTFAAYQPPDDDRIGEHLERLTLDPMATAVSEGTVRDATGNDVDIALSSRVVPDELLGNIVMVNVVDISEQRPPTPAPAGR